MAITKIIENQAGVPIEYWRIRDVYATNHDSGFQLTLLVEGYLSADSRKAGKRPVEERRVTVEAASDEKMGDQSLMEYLYGKLAEIEPFNGAKSHKAKLAKPVELVAVPQVAALSEEKPKAAAKSKTKKTK